MAIPSAHARVDRPSNARGDFVVTDVHVFGCASGMEQRFERLHVSVSTLDGPKLTTF